MAYSGAPNQLSFSTISRKSQSLNRYHPDAAFRLSQRLKDYVLSRGNEFSDLVDLFTKSDPHKTEAQRHHLTFGDSANMALSLVKKSKSSGKNLTRSATLPKNEFANFSQEIHGKSYPVPSKFYPESEADFHEKIKTADAATKKKMLPWAPKTPTNAHLYRITFTRRPPQNAQPDQELVPDSAFYFNTREEYEKARNYFKFIELLEKSKSNASTPPPQILLERLNQSFRNTFIGRFRNFLRSKAGEARKEQRLKKENLIRGNPLWYVVMKDAIGQMTNKWKGVATRKFTKRQDDEQAERVLMEKQNNITTSVKGSSLLQALDSYLIGALLEAWKDEGEKRIQSDKQDITIYFETIEVTAAIVQPLIKVEVSIGREYPAELIVNSKPIRVAADRKLNYTLDCRMKGIKNESTYQWKFVPREGILAADENQSSSAAAQKTTQTEKAFSIHFDDFIIEYLDIVEIKIDLLDESETQKAYHYTTLRNFYDVGRKGNNIWLCLNINQTSIDKFPLLHLKADSKYVDKTQKGFVEEIFVPPSYKLDRIKDSFYNYSFNLPMVTPKHEKFLSLFPNYWNIIDEKAKYLKRSGKFGDFVHTVKSRLARHYYESTSKQIARSKKTAILWAELQDELTSYKPSKKEKHDNSRVYVDEQYIKNLAGLQKPIINQQVNVEHLGLSQETFEDYNGIVSFLFKRDKWESKKEWRHFYDKLGVLCRKGIPHQNRINVWSELSRVVYFVNLTENEHKKQRGVKYYQQAYFEPERRDHSITADNIFTKSKKVYEALKKDAEREYVYLYQELEDDFEYLREQLGFDKQKIPFEKNIRNICRTFIFWAKIFSDPSTEEKIRYFVSYSRAILTLCHGLVTCQACSYLEKEVAIEEDQIFWLLIALATYIVASYFETNEKLLSVDKLTHKEGETELRKKQNIAGSGLKCSRMKGVKLDLLMLKLLLKNEDPELFDLFEELGVPLDYYFGDHLLTLFFNLFNPGMTFRIWDVLFFEGSSSNQVKCSRIMVCVLYLLLRECKPMLLKAKKASDIKFIVETYAKFQTRYGSFIREAYKICTTHYENVLPKDDTVLEKLSFIKYALFTQIYNKLDQQALNIEKTIEQNHSLFTLQQNVTLFSLANNKYQYRSSGDTEILSYAVLSKMIKDFQAYFGSTRTADPRMLSSMLGGANQPIINQQNTGANYQQYQQNQQYSSVGNQPYSNITGGGQMGMNQPGMAGQQQQQGGPLEGSPERRQRMFQEVNLDPKKFLKGKISFLSVKVHKLIIYSPNLSSLSLNMTFGKEKLKKKDLQALEIDYDVRFNMAGVKDTPRFLNIEIFDEKNTAQPLKIKYLNVDLKRIALDVPTKLILKFQEENPYVYNDNFITSEIELTLFLEGVGSHLTPHGPTYESFFSIPELENPIYDSFRDQRLGLDVVLPGMEFVTQTYSGLTFAKNRHAWKENFVTSYEEFINIMRGIAGFWINNADFPKIYETITKANKNQKFYISDFFALLILYGKFTSNQKFGLLFDLFTGFDDTFTDKTREIPHYILKGLCAYIYELFMVYMPQNELENIVDLVSLGNVPSIKKVVINNRLSVQGDYAKQVLNRVANFIHLNFNTREVHLYSDQVLSILRGVWEREALTPESSKSLANNKVEITYYTNGMTHKVKIEADPDWNLIETSTTQEPRTTVNITNKLLALYKQVVSLQNIPAIFGRADFVKFMQRLPLINYLCSLEHTDIASNLSRLSSVKFTVNLDGETVFVATPSTEAVQTNVLPALDDPNRQKLKKFNSLLREWDDVVRTSIAQINSRNNMYSNRGYGRNSRVRSAMEAQKIPISKLNIFFSYQHLIKYLKRSIIKTVSESINRSPMQAEHYNPNIFNKLLWDLDFTISLNINGARDFEVTDNNKSPFKTLLEVMERHFSSDRDIESIEIVFHLKNNVVPEAFTETYDQLALYRNADGSTEWLPCKIKYKFQYKKASSSKDGVNFDHIDGYGVVFARFPEETMVKKNAEVAIIQTIDIEELEMKEVDPQTFKVSTLTQYIAPEGDNSKRIMKRGAPGFFKGAQRRMLNSSEFDDGTGKLLRARTWGRTTSLPKGQVVKPGYPGVYTGARRKVLNSTEFLEFQRGAHQKVQTGAPGIYLEGTMRKVHNATDFEDEGLPLKGVPLPGQQGKTTATNSPQKQGSMSPHKVQGVQAFYSKQKVKTGDPGVFTNGLKQNYYASDFIDDEQELRQSTTQNMQGAAPQWNPNQVGSPQKHQVSGGYYDEKAPPHRGLSYSKSGSPQKVRTGDAGVYQQGVSIRSLNAGEIENEDGGIPYQAQYTNQTQGSMIYENQKYEPGYTMAQRDQNQNINQYGSGSVGASQFKSGQNVRQDDENFYGSYRVGR